MKDALSDDLGEADHTPNVTARTREGAICLKRRDLYSVNAGSVELLEGRDHRVTRRDFVSGLNVVPPHDSQFLHLRVQRGSFQTKTLSGTVVTPDQSLAFAEDPKY